MLNLPLQRIKVTAIVKEKNLVLIYSSLLLLNPTNRMPSASKYKSKLRQ